jgi:hypothetical protein
MDRYYRWSAWPIVSIDSIGIDPSIHRRLCPPLAHRNNADTTQLPRFHLSSSSSWSSSLAVEAPYSISGVWYRQCISSTPVQPYLYYYPSDWNASPEQDDLFFSVPSSGNTGETWDTVHTEGKSSRHQRDFSDHEMKSSFFGWKSSLFGWHLEKTRFFFHVFFSDFNLHIRV